MFGPVVDWWQARGGPSVMPVPARVAALVANPAGRQAALEAIDEVLVTLAREELELSPLFVEPLLEAAVRGEPIRLDTSDEAGRFGAGDWMFVAIVPLVVEAMERLLALLAVAGPNVAVDDTTLAAAIRPEDVRRIVRFIGARYTRTQVDVLTQTLRRALAPRLAALRASGI